MMNIGCSNQSLETLNILSLTRSTYPSALILVLPTHLAPFLLSISE